MDYKKLGKILKYSRVAAGLSQQYVADIINKTPQNISSWELGKSRIDMDSFEILCGIYKIPFVDTLNRIVNEHAEPEYMGYLDSEIMSNYKKLDYTGKNFVKQAIYLALQTADIAEDED
ncbi:MAG: helix-turn-helix transcriptional regulator [Clostridiales bacterium]|nr:helix-turn-helix transcriptional regulator [Clostridiales bacterium]